MFFMFKRLHPVLKAMRLISGYCGKRYACKGCLLMNDNGDCLVRDFDNPPSDWPVAGDR